MNVDRSRLEPRLGNYLVGTADALTDRSLLLRVQEYRRNSSARMGALDQESMKKKLPPSDYLVSRKIDGEFTVAVLYEDASFILNPYGTVRAGLPFLEEFTKRLKAAGIKRAEVVGELYFARPGGRERVREVITAARTPKKLEDLEGLRFAVFDLISIDGQPVQTPYPETYKQIQALFGGGERVHPIETVAVPNVAHVVELFDKWVLGEGSEGLVARSASAGVYKIKQRFTLNVAVIGYRESDEPDRVGMLHDLLVATVRLDGAIQVLGHVGGGFTDDERRDFLSDMKDIPAESDYAEVEEQIAYSMVEPKRAIEISCLDLITENTRGLPVNKMVLDWERDAYHAIRRLPLCSVISPQFLRIRDDKRVVPEDLSIKQLTDIAEIPMADGAVKELKVAESQVLRREVFRKTLKGATMVRKLLLWKTNKSEVSPNYPAFVAYVTDFSPNRAAPLDRDIRISDSQQQIEELYEQLKAKYIVGGWTPA